MTIPEPCKIQPDEKLMEMNFDQTWTVRHPLSYCLSDVVKGKMGNSLFNCHTTIHSTTDSPHTVAHRVLQLAVGNRLRSRPPDHHHHL